MADGRGRPILRSIAAAALLLVAGLTAGCSSGGGVTHAVSSHPTTGAVPRPAHIVVVVMENKSERQVVGRGDAPFINALARTGALFTHSYAIRHPSEPNYLALFSGSTQDLTDDSCPHTYTTPNLGGELRDAGLSFAGYAEGLPHAGDTTCLAGRYARKHAPWVNFTDLPPSVNLPYSAFPREYAALPTVSFVIPDLCGDMHNCSVATGDTWLRDHLGSYVTWAKSNDSLLILTFDENDGATGNKIATVFSGAGIKPGVYSSPIDHYSVLRTIEDAYGLPPVGNTAERSPITGPWATSRK